MDESNLNKPKPIPNDALRSEREKRHWTHEDVANLIKLPDSGTVGRWERGIYFPQPRYRRELCHIFGKSAEELGLEKLSPRKSLQQAKVAETYLSTEPLWNVPATLTSFIGREQEVAAICTQLKRADIRLITLLGPGGVGKSRICIQVAREMRNQFVDGVCFISLGTVKEPALVIPTIARELGIQESGKLPLGELVKRTLRDKQLLLLLDSFEQIMSEASFVEELLACCPDLKVLVTSRAVLHLQAEYEFPVSPLALPDLQQLPPPDALIQLASIALFVQRAQAILPSFEATPANIQSIARICVRLDGLPLAIELAAARIKLFPPSALLARLAQGLQLLKSDLLTLPARQQTLYNTIQWSYDLLDTQEKQLFRQISIFRGGCTLEAIEAIFGSGQEQTLHIVNVVSSLLDKSLLQQTEQEDRQPRLAMLDTIREYGQDCLRESGETEECQRAHALYYLGVVEEAGQHLKGIRQIEWLRRLESKQENLRAALQWFIEHKEAELALRFCESFGKFCGLQGYWSEEQRWLNMVLALSQPPLPQLAIRTKVLRRAGHLAYRLRDLEKAHALFEESMALSRALDDKQNLAGALNGLGWVCYRQKDIASASNLLTESVVVAYESRDSWAIANALESLGRWIHYQGRTDEAHGVLKESEAIARQLGDKECLARILTTLVSIELAQGHVQYAATLAQEALALAQALNTKPLIALVIDRLGDVALFQGEYERAAALFEERIELAQKLGDKSTIASRRLHLSALALERGDLAIALAFVQECLKFFREQGDNPNIAAALSIFGDIKRTQKDFPYALDLYKEALQLDKDVGNKRSIGRHLIGVAKVALEQERSELAAYVLGLVASVLGTSVDMHPAQQAEYAHMVERIRALLGEEDFVSTWSKGCEVSLEQGLATLKDFIILA